MALPAKCLRVIMYGRLFGIQDWSTGYWIQGASGATEPTAAQLQDLLDDIWNLGAAPYTAWRPLNFTTSTVIGLRAYWYGDGGPTATMQADFAPSGGSVGTGTKRVPPLASMVVSMQTGKPGRSYRGRMYFPISGVPDFNNNGEITSTVIDSFCTSQKAHFDAVNALDTSGIWLGSSEVVVASATKGVSTKVTSLQVDSIVDTQHRRTNDFTATYTKEVALA